MAIGGMSCEGYKCDFIDSVPDVCFCKKCSLVARKLTVTSCCSMSFCYACISSFYNQGKPCPVCGQPDFSRHSHRKFQRWISNYKIYCTNKVLGCGWSGKVDQLEAHLDPDGDNCQYVGTKCPFNCQQTIPKKKVEQHVAEECVRRDFTCQHCNFKATYEEVVGKHLGECRNAPRKCPFSCGATLKLEMMDDHIKNCPGVTECQFRAVGCDEKIPRQDQEEHSKRSIQKHVQLTAAATVSGCQHLYNITCEQGKRQNDLDEKRKKWEEKMCRKMQQMEEKLSTLEHQQTIYQQEKERMLEQVYQLRIKLEEEKSTENKLGLYQEHFQELEEKLKERLDYKLEKKIKETDKLMKFAERQQQKDFQVMEEKLKKHLEQQRQQHLEQQRQQHLEQQGQQHLMVEKQSNFKLLGLNLFGTKQIEKVPVLAHSFVIEHFELQLGTSNWRSPTFYTHDHGYKYVVEINLSKTFQNRAKGMDIEFNHRYGECDAQLKWPVRVDFTFDLCNAEGQKLYNSTYSAEWEKRILSTIHSSTYCSQHAIPLSRLVPYVRDGGLHFNITNTTIH